MSSNRTSRVAKNTVMLYIRMAFTMLVSLYTSRVVLNTLGVVDYGINNVVGGTVTFLTFLVFSMNTATQRFLNVAMGKNDEEEVKHVFSISVTIHFIILVLVLIIGEIVGLWLLYNKLVIPADRMTAAFWLFQFTMVSTCTTIMSIPYNAEVIAHEKMGIYAWLSMLDVILKLIVVYLLVISPVDKLITFGFLTMCTFILNRTLYTIYCKRNFKECKYSIHFPRKLFKEMLVFASWDLFGVFAWACATQGATILLNMFFGPTVNAARGIAGTVLGAVKGFSNNFTTALNPAITKAYAAKDYTYMNKLMYSGSKLVFILLFTIMLPLFIKCHYVLELWLNIVPDYSVSFIRILLVQTLVVTMWAPVFISGIATGNLKTFGVITSTLNILQIIVCYIILNAGSKPVETILVLALWETFAYSIQFITLKRLIEFHFTQYALKVLLKTGIVVLVAGVPATYLSNYLSDNLLNLVYTCIVACSLSLVFSFFILLDKSEKSFVLVKIFKKNIYEVDKKN